MGKVNTAIFHVPVPNRVVSHDPENLRSQSLRDADVHAINARSNFLALIKGVKGAAQEGTNMVDPMMVAAEAYATIGEISDALREVYGEYVRPAYR